VDDATPMPIEPCQACAEAVQLLGRLQQLAYQGSGLTFSARPLDANGGCSTPDYVSVAFLHVDCQKCKGTRYVFTADGVKMIDLLQRQGYLPKGPPPPVNPPTAVMPDQVEEVPF
jgi:hypothetical protein